MRIIRYTAIAVCMMLVLSCVSAAALSAEEIGAPSAVLMDAGTGKILFEKNMHEKRACASVTKVMTLLLVMEALDEGRIHLDDTVTASAHAASMGGSDIWLEQGEQMSADDMIKATAVASANDAAVALAEHIAGSENDFVAMMNARAKELGMNDTTFLNCNGLDEEGHLTSAYDVAVMSCELIRHEKIFDYTSIWIDELRGGETQIVNTNKLLRTYDGITGLKTGTTSQAGSCITATAERSGTRLCAVVLGADTGTGRFKDAAALLDYGFANYETVTLSAAEDIYPLKVKGGMKDTVDITCAQQGVVTVKKGKGDSVRQTIHLPESIDAPVKKGDPVGKLRYSLEGEDLAEYDIIAAEDDDKMTFSAVMGALLGALVRL